MCKGHYLESKDLYNVLKDAKSINACRPGLEAALGRVGFSHASSMAKDAVDVIHVIHRKYELQPTAGRRKEYIAAAKRHKDEISRFCSSLIRESKISGVSNPVVKVQRSKIIFFDGTELVEEKIDPRSYWKLYRLIIYTTFCETSTQLIEVLRVITTLASLCKDFALVGKEQDDDVMNQIEEIRSFNANLCPKKDWTERVDETLSLIRDAVVGRKMSDLPPHLKSFASTLMEYKRKFSRPELTPDVLKLTSASTGTSLNGETLPGSLASVFESVELEFDFSKFDGLTNYVGNDIEINIPRGSRIRSRRNYSVAIPQHKDAMRIIHVLTNSLHDRLTFFEIIRKEFLKTLPADCVYNQFRGRNSILKWCRDRSTKAIYSLDLHAATNTLSLQWQSKVTRWMLEILEFSDEDINILMEAWDWIMSLDSIIKLPYSKKEVRFSFASGQPMGFSDSFFSFDMLHHIIVLSALSEFLEISNSNLRGYHIVGDDFVIAFDRDRDYSFPFLYQDIMAFMNTECNLDKGYIFNEDVPGKELRIAEFCKFLICEDADITPIPWGCLSSSESTSGRLVLLGWLNQHLTNGTLTPNKVVEFCGMNSKERLAVELMVRMPLQNILNSKRGQFRVDRGWALKDARLIFAASVAMLQDTFLLRYLVEKNRDPDYIPKLTDLRSFKRKGGIRRLMRTLYDPEKKCFKESSNKFLFWLNSLELKATANDIAIESLLSGVFPGEDVLEILPSLVALDPDLLIQVKETVDSFASLVSDREGGEQDAVNPLLDDEVCESQLNLIRDLSLVSIDSTNHRFGKLERISQGIDLESFVNRTLEYAQKLGYSSEDVETFLLENVEAFKFSEKDPELWVCSPMQLEIDEEDEDESEEIDSDEFWAEFLS